MIQSNELRIGNWFFNGEQYVRFKAFHNGKIYHTYGWCLPDDELHWQIPLTREILEKAGFEFINKTGASGADMWAGMPAWKINGDWMFRGTAACLHLVGYFNTQVQYLHQLQNLYFDLTGTELQIEL